MRTAVLLAILAACVPASAQWTEKPRTGSAPEERPDRTVLQGQTGTSTNFGVRLVKTEEFAKQHKALVEAQVYGLELVSPGQNQAPNEYQGHIVYRVDNGPEQTAANERFEIAGLSLGNHTIAVHLADNEGHAISPEHRLLVRIPH